jgi:hypothetical protein
MQTFSEAEAFTPILDKMKSGELKTSNQLRIMLDELSERFHISSLNFLCIFRAWLLTNNIELSTEYGSVSFVVLPS